jgi:hypothetical protein
MVRHHDRMDAAVNDDTLPKLAGGLALVSAYNRRRCFCRGRMQRLGRNVLRSVTAGQCA